MKAHSRILWLPLLLAAAALIWRVLKLRGGLPDHLPNFAPWMALSFAGGALMSRQVPGWLWAVALILTDTLFLGVSAFAEMWTVFACYLVAGIAGSALRGKASVLNVVGGTVGSGLLFYLVTNTQAWFASAAYTKNFAGWVQALTVGDPRYQPQTWVFGLGSMVSDLVFAVLLVVAFNSEAVLRKLPRLAFQREAQIA